MLGLELGQDIRSLKPRKASASDRKPETMDPTPDPNGNIRIILGIYWGNGKNGNYYLGFRVVDP